MGESISAPQTKADGATIFQIYIIQRIITTSCLCVLQIGGGHFLTEQPNQDLFSSHLCYRSQA